MYRASVWATPSNVLWSSLRTITRQAPPMPEPGPFVRGSSMVWLMRGRIGARTPAGRAIRSARGRLALGPIALEPRIQGVGRHRVQVALARPDLGAREGLERRGV